MHNGHASFGFLQRISREELQSLETISSPLTFKKKQFIFRANLTNNHIYVITKGRVKLSRLSATGQECIQWFCFEGEIFGLSENTYEHDSGLYAQALTTTSLWAIPKSKFKQLLLRNPGMAVVIVEQLSSRVRNLGDMLLHISCDNAHDRLVNLLQRLGDMYGIRDNDEIHIDMKLTHQEIADMIGVCRQTVSSMMTSLKRSGFIADDRQGISIRCPGVVDEQLPARTTGITLN